MCVNVTTQAKDILSDRGMKKRFIGQHIKLSRTKKKDQAQDRNIFLDLCNKTGVHSNSVASQLLFYSIVSMMYSTERTMIGCIFIHVHDVFYYQTMNLDSVSRNFLTWTVSYM